MGGSGRARHALAGATRAAIWPATMRGVLANADQQRRLALAQEVDADEVQARRDARSLALDREAEPVERPRDVNPSLVARPKPAREHHRAEAGPRPAPRAHRRQTARVRDRRRRQPAAAARSRTRPTSCARPGRPTRRSSARSAAKCARRPSAPEKMAEQGYPHRLQGPVVQVVPATGPGELDVRQQPHRRVRQRAQRRVEEARSRRPTRPRRARRSGAPARERARTRGTPRGPRCGAPRRSGSPTPRFRRRARRRAAASAALRYARRRSGRLGRQRAAPPAGAAADRHPCHDDRPRRQRSRRGLQQELAVAAGCSDVTATPSRTGASNAAA